MPYWTTREVARHLHLNEKKIYALVAAGQLPAARISGKWLFEPELIDRWVREHTVYPTTGVLGGLLDRMVVLQGSDDWLLDQALDGVREALGVSVVTSRVGSLTGLRALRDGRAHLAGVHVDPAALGEALGPDAPAYTVGLFRREQVLVISPRLRRQVRSLADVVDGGLRFADRQAGAGTHVLVRRLLVDARRDPAALRVVGPYATHLEVALAVRTGQADAGAVIRVAAERAGLPFVPLAEETFQLAIPAAFMGHPSVARLLDAVLHWCHARRRRGEAPGYGFTPLGKIAATTAAANHT